LWGHSGIVTGNNTKARGQGQFEVRRVATSPQCSIQEFHLVSDFRLHSHVMNPRRWRFVEGVYAAPSDAPAMRSARVAAVPNGWPQACL
jgi:hypothetical protein